jgi:DnaJ-domain-containing protein 1
MSYSQIFRRVRRIIETTAGDVRDFLTKEESDLFNFDEELRRHAQQSHAQQQRKQSGPQPGGKGQSSSRQSGSGSSSAQSGGKRKPGEKDDAYYLQILGLTAVASNDEIRKTYRRLLSKYHPDRVATLSAEAQSRATEKAKALNEAYQIIARRRGIR